MLVFAYGSLLWRPGFAPVRSRVATARNWQRRWCIESFVHRGTTEAQAVM